jgi:hypothetical protein
MLLYSRSILLELAMTTVTSQTVAPCMDSCKVTEVVSKHKHFLKL